MKIRKISHVGIAVRSLRESRRFYGEVLGLEPLGEELVSEQKVRVAMFRLGESRIELLEPTDEDSPVARFLAKRGEGVHHIAYEVEEIDEALGELASGSARLIDQQPRIGAGGAKIAFVHPASASGVLTELCQPADAG